MWTIMLSGKVTLGQNHFHVFVESSDVKTMRVVLLLPSTAGSFQYDQLIVFSHSYYLVVITIIG